MRACVCVRACMRVRKSFGVVACSVLCRPVYGLSTYLSPHACACALATFLPRAPALCPPSCRMRRSSGHLPAACAVALATFLPHAP